MSQILLNYIRSHNLSSITCDLCHNIVHIEDFLNFYDDDWTYCKFDRSGNIACAGIYVDVAYNNICINKEIKYGESNKYLVRFEISEDQQITYIFIGSTLKPIYSTNSTIFSNINDRKTTALELETILTFL